MAPRSFWKRTFIGNSLRLASDPSYGGGGTAKPGAGGFLLRKCGHGESGEAPCDAVLQGWHGMSACFGANPSACWLDVVGKGVSVGGCPCNLQR